jgi:hypothetical protein
VNRPRLALHWAVAAGVVSACSIGACLTGRAFNDLYAREVLWIVAQYRASDVWWSLVLINLVAWAWLAQVVFGGAKVGRPLALRSLLAVAITLLLGLELGMGIYYQQMSGELRIENALFTRAALDFPSTPDGVCVRADLRDRWTWRLNEHSIRPALLPLALDDAKLRSRLLAPGQCAR